MIAKIPPLNLKFDFYMTAWIFNLQILSFETKSDIPSPIIFFSTFSSVLSFFLVLFGVHLSAKLQLDLLYETCHILLVYIFTKDICRLFLI